MAFFYYDLAFLILSTILVVWFLRKNKRNLKKEGLMYLYRTQVGLKFINYVGSRYKRTLHVLSYVVITTGYILMALSVYMLVELLRAMILIPELAKVTKIPPITPLIPYLPQLFKVDFLPPFYFTYWIISIAIIAVFHEFAHGIFAKHYGIKVKSTGFGFLGPFLAAFVEPDEKQFAKKSRKAQITILAAGSFANVLVTILFFGIFALFFMAFYTPAGILFDDYARSEVAISTLTNIGSIPFASPSLTDLSSFLSSINKTEYADVTVATKDDTIRLISLASNNRNYLISASQLEQQIDRLNKNEELNQTLVAFDDAPAIRAGIFGAIKSINGAQLTSRQDLEHELDKYNPSDTIELEILNTDYTLETKEIILAEHPLRKGESFMGIGFRNVSAGSPIKVFKILSDNVVKVIRSFRQDNVFYMPKGNAEFIIFIYNLLYWIILINISVAVVNMMPLGIFDGGKTFLLTIAAITKSEKTAKRAYKIVTHILIWLFILLTVIWFVNFFK